MGDTIENSATVQPDIPGVGAGVPDGSNEVNKISDETFTKTLYAINGALNPSAPYNIKAGDKVTYRLKGIDASQEFL